jgi:predicted TIM-barrel enzyme
VAAARELDLLTTPYVFDVDQAKDMARAGADILVAHMGLTTSGSIGAETAKSLEDCVRLINEIVQAASSVRTDLLILCHGGPIAEPEDAKYVLERCPGVSGFYGASSMERLPTERAITDQVRQFTSICRP